MLEKEREMARSNDDLDLFLKTSCILRVSEGHLQKEVAEMFGVSLRSLAKADPEKQKEWTEKELPEIEKRVRSDDGVLMSEDEASFQQSGSLTHTWCAVGTGCEVMSIPTRKSIKAFGAIAIDENPKWHFRFEKEKFNGDSFMGLLKQLIRQYPERKVHLITDNARYHKGPKLREWVAANADSIALHFLPKYSPKFNATEYVWRKVKRLTTHNRYFKTAKELARELFRRFNRFQGNPASLRNTIAGFT